MARDIIIVGAGGFGKEVSWTLRRMNRAAGENLWNLLGYADDDPAKHDGTYDTRRLLGTPEEAAARYPRAVFFIAVGSNAVRRSIADRLHALGAEFPAVVDPSADVSGTAEVLAGAYVGPQAVVSVDAKVGHFAIVNARAGVGHDSRVGDFAQLCPGVSLSGSTQVGRGAFLGTNASTVPGVTVGEEAKVAAGMPVYRDVATGSTLSPFGVFKG